MAEEDVTVIATMRVKFAWWLPLYLRAVTLVAWLTAREPDYDKVAGVVRHGMRTQIEVAK